MLDAKVLECARFNGNRVLVGTMGEVMSAVQEHFTKMSGVPMVDQPAVLFEHWNCPRLQDPGDQSNAQNSSQSGGQPDVQGEQQAGDQQGDKKGKPRVYDPTSSLQAWRDREACVVTRLDLRAPGVNGKKNTGAVAKAMMNLLVVNPERLTTDGVTASKAIDLAKKVIDQTKLLGLVPHSVELHGSPNLLASEFSPKAQDWFLETGGLAFNAGGLQIPFKSTMFGPEQNKVNNFTQMVRIVCYLFKDGWMNTYFAAWAFKVWAEAYFRFLGKDMSKTTMVGCYDLREFYENPQYAAVSFCLRELGIPPVMQFSRTLPDVPLERAGNAGLT